LSSTSGSSLLSSFRFPYQGSARSLLLNAMQESPVRVGGAVEHLEPGPLRNEKDRKRMEENGGIRPGKGWPQYLAATLGTWLTLCLTLRVPDRVQIYVADQLKVAISFRSLLSLFFSHLSLHSVPLRNKIGAAPLRHVTRNPDFVM
jgi:hypothetical protein